MTNTISPYMAAILLDHYRELFCNATTTTHKAFLRSQIAYYSRRVKKKAPVIELPTQKQVA